MQQHPIQSRSTHNPDQAAAHNPRSSGISLPAVTAFQLQEEPIKGNFSIQREGDERLATPGQFMLQQSAISEEKPSTRDRFVLQRNSIYEESPIQQKEPFELKLNNTGLSDRKSGHKTTERGNNNTPVYQLFVDVDYGDENGRFYKQLNANAQTININWIGRPEIIYDLIQSATDNIQAEEHKEGSTEEREREDKLKKLKNFETKTDDYVKAGNALVKEYNDTKKGLTDDFFQLRKLLFNLQAEIQEIYYTSKGGFNAKGRAHDIEAKVIEKNASTEKESKDSKEENNFINNTVINNQLLTDKYNVHKKKTVPDPGVIRRNILGDKKLQDNKKESLLKDFNKNVLPPQPFIDHTYKTKVTYKTREEGQESAMHNTNARGYAWLTNDANWNQTRWEWLHIRGAALGGATNSKNLVLGTRDSNTHMMPFESHLCTLANYAAKNKEKYDGLQVIWTLANQTGTYSHKFATIKIAWKLLAKEGGNIEGKATFNPLDGSAVLSKNEVEFLQQALKQEREGIDEGTLGTKAKEEESVNENITNIETDKKEKSVIREGPADLEKKELVSKENSTNVKEKELESKETSPEVEKKELVSKENSTNVKGKELESDEDDSEPEIEDTLDNNSQTDIEEKKIVSNDNEEQPNDAEKEEKFKTSLLRIYADFGDEGYLQVGKIIGAENFQKYNYMAMLIYVDIFSSSREAKIGYHADKKRQRLITRGKGEIAFEYCVKKYKG